MRFAAALVRTQVPPTRFASVVIPPQQLQSRILHSSAFLWRQQTPVDELYDAGDMNVHIKPTPMASESIDDVEFLSKGSRATPDKTPGKYDQVKQLITKYRSAPRALYQKELVKNGIKEDDAKRYADKLEARGMDTEDKVQLMLRRIRPRYPKLS